MGIVILVIVLAGLLILIGAANYMVDFSIKRGSGASSAIDDSLVEYDSPEQEQIETAANAYKKQVRAEADQWVEQMNPEVLSVTTEDGLKLQARFFQQKGQNADNHLYSILVHGYGSSFDYVEDYAKAYYEKGYHVLTPDMRAMGGSEGTYIGMGWLDRMDMLLWIKTITDRDPDAEIVMHGFSMGAATIMMLSGEEQLPEQVKVFVEDCGYSSDWAELSDKLHKIYHLPDFPLMYAVNVMTKLKAGYYVSEASCIKQLAKNETPMLFIHGDMDDYNPYYMLDEVYEANACQEKEKLVVHGARHVMSAYTEPETYWNTVWKFIEKYI
ncbi:MAG: alpha/beta hydrolase [Lachnospiraceae bacterium]|nr:alpha/beta hydrolase [Lachnospiraceae bacterium]